MKKRTILITSIISLVALLMWVLDCPASTCDPKGQGYWHRQCLGVPANEGGLDPGRNGRGPNAPTEPDFNPVLMDCADDILDDLDFTEVTTCEGMDADPPNDPCEKAMKQLTALILNVCSDRLGGEFCDGVEVSCESTTVEELLSEIAELIGLGDCKQAARCAVMVNAGYGLVDDESDCNNCVPDGTADGDILTWNVSGNNWIAQPPDPPEPIGDQTIPIRQPFLAIYHIIALQGIFPSRSSEEPFLGEIAMVGFSFPPRGWALCDGQLLAISSNAALFSLLGTTYGGDGRTTFGLPDLRGRVPVHVGTGPGLTPYPWGMRGGSETNIHKHPYSP